MPALRAASANALMRAYAATDEWELTLALTEHRLASAEGARAKVKVLSEAAHLAEERGHDANAAFGFMARAFVETPSDAAVEAELTRLAEVTGQWDFAAAAYTRVLEDAERAEQAPDPTWIGGLRFRLGEIVENRLRDPERALAVFVRAAADAPADLGIARATIRVGARAKRWDAAAKALVGASRALGQMPEELPQTVEEFVQGPEAWDGMARAVGAALEQASDLTPAVSRDLEARLGVRHRDRRGDSDLAEAASRAPSRRTPRTRSSSGRWRRSSGARRGGRSSTASSGSPAPAAATSISSEKPRRSRRAS